jgi:histidinol-phosphate/aromatic aminotransferase/cobyric acid decarboxylase-like protein
MSVDTPMKARLAAVRLGLLQLHKALLDAERDRYEQIHGKVTAGKMLQLALQDARFAWLRSLSELIVRIDERLEEEASDSDLENLLATARSLLTTAGQPTSFAVEYDAALQRDPQIVVLHGRVMQSLSE